jgi:hypothetical protein
VNLYHCLANGQGELPLIGVDVAAMNEVDAMTEAQRQFMNYADLAGKQVQQVVLFYEGKEKKA